MDERNKIAPEKDITEFIKSKNSESLKALSLSRVNLVNEITKNVEDQINSIQTKKAAILDKIKKITG